MPGVDGVDVVQHWIEDDDVWEVELHCENVGAILILTPDEAKRLGGQLMNSGRRPPPGPDGFPRVQVRSYRTEPVIDDKILDEILHGRQAVIPVGHKEIYAAYLWYEQGWSKRDITNAIRINNAYLNRGIERYKYMFQEDTNE